MNLNLNFSMKKIMFFNFILILLLNVLPNKKILDETPYVSVIEETAIIPQEIQNIVVSSRSEEIREYIVPTKYSENLVEYIKKKEGFYSNAYKLDGETMWTIGYGHHGNDVKEGDVINEEKADKLLRAELDGINDYVLNYCEYLQLNQNQLDALISFTMNGGIGMLHQLTANQTRTKEEIAEHITAYTKSGSEKYRAGLLKRRQEEKEMFLKEE